MKASVVLCEGYYDRAFWAGWLIRLGIPEPKDISQVRDPWDKPVTRGRFGYHTHSGNYVEVVPCHGKDNILQTMRIYLSGLSTKPLHRLILNIDTDIGATEPRTETGLRDEDVLREVGKVKPGAELNSEGDVILDEGDTIVSLIRWETLTENTAYLPLQQCLERLVCAAIIAVYPDRGPAVQRWLETRPEPPPTTPKVFAWSHMAGWYGERSCEDFYKAIWEDDEIVRELQSRLEVSGAWRIAEALAS